MFLPELEFLLDEGAVEILLLLEHGLDLDIGGGIDGVVEDLVDEMGDAGEEVWLVLEMHVGLLLDGVVGEQAKDPDALSKRADTFCTMAVAETSSRLRLLRAERLPLN